jgi:hypothetical protein
LKSWEELSELEQLQCTYSDAYKDAYGFRPRGFMSMTVAELREELNRLGAVIADQESQRECDEAEAVTRFEARVAETIKTGASDRETALRWIHQAEGTDGDDEFLCYNLGLPYNYFRKRLLNMGNKAVVSVSWELVDGSQNLYTRLDDHDKGIKVAQLANFRSATREDADRRLLV